MVDISSRVLHPHLKGKDAPLRYAKVCHGDAASSLSPCFAGPLRLPAEAIVRFDDRSMLLTEFIPLNGEFI